MRIQLVSDLHLERFERRFPQQRLVQPAPGADLLVLAGDIHNGVAALRTFGDWPVPVLYVAGNHEFYDHERPQTRDDLLQACQGTSVTFLDNAVIVRDGVRILGSTLWTDFGVEGADPELAMQVVEGVLTDYRVIRAPGGPLTAGQTLADHQRSRRWLQAELTQPFDGPTVVVTHHAPHPLSIHPRFAGNPVNPAFVSDLTPLLPGADLWLHGHTHDSFDYRLGRCRVVANPAGYVLNRDDPASPVRPLLENTKFDPSLVLVIGG